MAVSLLSLDKYAILVSGDTSPRYLKDIGNVYRTIRYYYGYPDEHIWIVLGNNSAVPAGVPAGRIFTLSGDATAMSTFNTLFNQFITAASSPPVPASSLADPFKNSRKAGDMNTGLVYFTGVGTNNSADYQVVIGNDGVSDIPLGTLDLISLLITNPDFFTYCHFQLVMQQNYSGGFYDNMWINIFPDGSMTYSCQGSETTAATPSDGSEMTYHWVKALQMQASPSGIYAGKFADELPAPNDDVTDNMISLEKALVFVTSQTPAITGTAQYKFQGTEKHYLGKPQFLIRDGSPTYWISPDVYLSHPDVAPDFLESSMDNPESEYVVDTTADYNNFINVCVRNHGTHPVRKFQVGGIVFLSGCSGTGNSDEYTVTDTDMAGILCPVPCDSPVQINDGTIIRSFEHLFDHIHFTNTNHRCLRGKAKLYDLNPIDFSIWDILGMDDEAQRNIDIWVTTKSLSNGSGKGKKVPFFMQNPLKVPARLTFMVPRDILKISDMVKTNFTFVRDKKKLPIALPVKGQNKIHGFTTDLAAGKAASIELELLTTDIFSLKEDVVLNFPITVEGNRNTRHKWPKDLTYHQTRLLLEGSHWSSGWEVLMFPEKFL